MSTVLWQRIEGALVFLAVLLGVYAFNALTPVAPWWGLLILFFAPDLGFLGYLAGPRVGAAVYNTLHLYGLALFIALIGFVGLADALIGVIGLLWLGHVGFDRMLGYGLKEPTAFADTHLGRIGNRR
ncbi:MAG: DUF4260 domain-containing protein [Paracoccaceae bacterium]